MTEHEKEALKRKAAKNGMTVSEYARTLAAVRIDLDPPAVLRVSHDAPAALALRKNEKRRPDKLPSAFSRFSESRFWAHVKPTAAK